jgi:hypothetical protein
VHHPPLHPLVGLYVSGSPHCTQRGAHALCGLGVDGSSALGRVRVSPATLNLETDTLHMLLAEAFIVRFPELAETR